MHMPYEYMMKNPMLSPTAVEPRDGYNIWLQFVDGIEGMVDVSYLASHGKYAALADRTVFERVHINEDGVVSWGCPDGYNIDADSELEICTESDYIALLGLNPSEVWGMERESRNRIIREARDEYETAKTNVKKQIAIG